MYKILFIAYTLILSAFTITEIPNFLKWGLKKLIDYYHRKRYGFIRINENDAEDKKLRIVEYRDKVGDCVDMPIHFQEQEKQKKKKTIRMRLR